MSAVARATASWDAPSTSRFYHDLAEAMHHVRTFILPKDIGNAIEPDRPRETPDQAKAIQFLAQHDRIDELMQDFLEEVEGSFYLVKRDIDAYVARMEDAATTSTDGVENGMKALLNRLITWQRSWAMPLRRLNDVKHLNAFISTFHSLLHAALPAVFLTHLHTFLTLSVRPAPGTDDTLPEKHHAELESLQSIPIPAPAARAKVLPPSPHLSRLGIFLRYSSVFMNVALEEIERVARDEMGKGWDARRLNRARMRVGQGVVGWVAGLMEGQNPGMAPEIMQTTLRSIFSRFDYFLCKCFFDVRTDELFDIIVDYPDSISALEDLKECLFKVDQRGVLVKKLKAANSKRLLHPGAETNDVLTQYISTIRCLRILDPPGVLLHKVAEPIRKHLRDRPDTIKHIVAALVEGDELQDESENGGGGLIKIDGNEDELEDFLDPRWEPEPIDAAPEFRSGKAGDITSTLVSIYETRDVIVTELQILLAQRLLAVKDYDAVKEIRIIELLKLRFGEQALQVCDVMLKDMADSKRIDDRIQGDIKTAVHPIVLSNRFWPEIENTSLRLAPALQDIHEQYESAFHHFKPDKHLRWIQHLGTVTLHLEMDDRVIQAEATPLQASVAMLFEERPKWGVAELAEKLDVEERSVRDSLAFWSEEGLVRDADGTWEVVEKLD